MPNDEVTLKRIRSVFEAREFQNCHNFLQNRLLITEF